ATKAADVIAASHAIAEGFGDLAQDFVATRVPVLVVELLEVVDIDDQQGEGAVAAPRTLEFRRHHLVEIAPVRHPGQGVGAALVLQFAHPAGQGQGQQDHFHQGAHLESVLGEQVVRQHAEHLEHVGQHADQQHAPGDHEIACGPVALDQAEYAQGHDQRGHDHGQNRDRQDQHGVWQEEGGNEARDSEYLRGDREPVQQSGKPGRIEKGAGELHAEDQRQRQHDQQSLVAPVRAVRPEELEGQPVVDGEIQAVARRVQQIVDEGAVANDQEDEEVVQDENDEAAVIHPVGDLFDAERGDQRVRAVHAQAEIDRTVRICAQVNLALALARHGQVEDEIAMGKFARRERRAVAGGDVTPAAVALFHPEVEMIDQRIVFAKQDVAVVGAAIGQGEAHPPGGAGEAEVGTDFGSGGEHAGLAYLIETQLAARVFEHLNFGLYR